LSKRSHLWLIGVAILLAAVIFAAAFFPRSFSLTAFSDITQCLLLLSGTASFIPLVVRSRGRNRLFWSLITLGLTLWLAYQLFWTYYEVILQQEVPDLCAWDIVLFLHIVPFMAAIALRPHAPRDEYSARVGRLDFALLIIWWFYLYLLVVIPWQYVLADIPAYNRNLNDVYSAEKLALLLGLLACWITSKDDWRRVYTWLFGMSFCYSAASTIANWAIARKAYYSGSAYDIPLVVAMASVTWIGLRAKADRPASNLPEASTVYGVWVARVSMITVFSLPAFAAWSISDAQIPLQIRTFRVALTLIAAFCMGVMIFVRQRMLDRELVRLLNHSRESFDNLKRLQAQILQSEKLASIGQLVGGAAHELNNPITAMLGYSDLLLSTSLSPEQQPIATKIGQYVRRTKSLVASLISFARQGPAPKTPLDLNTLARTAIKLSEPQWSAVEVEVRTQFDAALPKVFGDSNQLLQVCIQLIANCLHALGERDGRVMIVSTERLGGTCQLTFATEGVNKTKESVFPLDAEDALGLSACQGILQEHRGIISRDPREDGSLVLRMELPVTESATANGKEATSPGLWQSQPYA